MYHRLIVLRNTQMLKLRSRSRLVSKPSYHIITTKAPVTPNGDATAFVQRFENMSARCGVAAK